MKPCPFCGGKELAQSTTGGGLLNRVRKWYVECLACGARGPARALVAPATAGWDAAARPNDPTPPDAARLAIPRHVCSTCAAPHDRGPANGVNVYRCPDCGTVEVGKSPAQVAYATAVRARSAAAAAAALSAAAPPPAEDEPLAIIGQGTSETRVLP